MLYATSLWCVEGKQMFIATSPIVPVVDHLAGHAAIVADSKADCVLLVFMLQKYTLFKTQTPSGVPYL